MMVAVCCLRLCCSLCDVCCLLFVVRRLPFVFVICLLFAGRCSVCAVCCMMCVVCCAMFVVCRLLSVVVCCMLYVVG